MPFDVNALPAGPSRHSIAGYIIENCEVTGFRRGPNGAVAGVETTRGDIATTRVGVVAAGHSSVVMARAGVRMPLESFPLQALATS